MFNILKHLESDNSRNVKIKILTTHKDNTLLKEVVRLALDPFTQFYIKKIPECDTIQLENNNGIKWAIEQLTKLSSRELTGHAGRDHLIHILENVKASDAEVIKRIISKDLKCGVSIGTVNKIWPSLIPKFPCMLCSPFNQKLIDEIKFPAIVQKKEDGMRFNAIVKDGAVEYRSRNGKNISLLGNLDTEFLALSAGSNVVYDGELLVQNDNGIVCDRQTGNGILNKAVKGTIKEDDASNIIATLWDAIPYDAFIDCKFDKVYSDRFNHLEYIMYEVKPTRIKLIESYSVNSIEETQSLFQQYLTSGHEGIILKDGNSIWENKRSKGQIKFKAELDCDLICKSVISGSGKYKDMIGSLYCESSDGDVRVYVGSGLKDNQRINSSDYLNKIIAVKYNARIKNVKGEESLFLPIFLEVREDKDVADSSNDIK
jgi:hypothetical protein